MSSKFHVPSDRLSALPSFVKTLTPVEIKGSDKGSGVYDAKVAKSTLDRLRTTFNAKHCSALMTCLLEIYNRWLQSKPPLRYVMEVSQALGNMVGLTKNLNSRSNRATKFNNALVKNGYPDLRHRFFAIGKDKDESKRLTAQRKATYKKGRDAKLSHRVEINASQVKSLLEFFRSKMDRGDGAKLTTRRRQEILKFTSAYVALSLGLRPVEIILPDLTNVQKVSKTKVKVTGFAKVKRVSDPNKNDIDRSAVRPLLPGADADDVISAIKFLRDEFAAYNKATKKPVITYNGNVPYAQPVSIFFRAVTRFLQKSKDSPVQAIRDKYQVLKRSQFSMYTLRHLYFCTAFGVFGKQDSTTHIQSYLPKIGGWGASADVTSISYSDVVVHNDLDSKSATAVTSKAPVSEAVSQMKEIRELKSKLAVHEKLLYAPRSGAKRSRSPDKENKAPSSPVKRKRLRRPPLVNVAVLSQARRDRADTLTLADGSEYSVAQLWSQPTLDKSIQMAYKLLSSMSDKAPSVNQVKALIGGNSVHVGKRIKELIHKK